MPAAPRAPQDLADAVFRVGRAHGMTADRSIYQAVAVQGGRITAVGRSRDELDSFIGPGTAVIDDPELVLYPAFTDTHNHQLLAARDLDYVSLEQARSIGELVQALREAAARTPAGEWIISSRCWHETHLREGRLPTARELDAASGEHPVFVQRGGHVGVANSAALRLAGITATAADPPSGTVVRLADGTPAGVLIEAAALDPVRRLLPPVTQAQQADLLARQCQLYNRRGIGVVRDPGLVPDEVAVYQAVADRGELTRSAGSWTPTSGWRRGTRACRREPSSSSTPSWPTRRLAPARCGWASGSPCSTRCCTRWAATWCGTGARNAPAR